MDNIKPCPCCGSKDLTHITQVRCNECDLFAPNLLTWNQRKGVEECPTCKKVWMTAEERISALAPKKKGNFDE